MCPDATSCATKLFLLACALRAVSSATASGSWPALTRARASPASVVFEEDWAIKDAVDAAFMGREWNMLYSGVERRAYHPRSKQDCTDAKSLQGQAF